MYAISVVYTASYHSYYASAKAVKRRWTYCKLRTRSDLIEFILIKAHHSI